MGQGSDYGGGGIDALSGFGGGRYERGGGGVQRCFGFESEGDDGGVEALGRFDRDGDEGSDGRFEGRCLRSRLYGMIREYYAAVRRWEDY